MGQHCANDRVDLEEANPAWMSPRLRSVYDRHQVVDRPVSTLLEGLKFNVGICKKLQMFANGLETVGVKCNFFLGWVGWVVGVMAFIELAHMLNTTSM